MSAGDAMEAEEEKSAISQNLFVSSNLLILNEDVFISQLQRRGQLLNSAFQQALLNELLRHSNGRVYKFKSDKRISVQVENSGSSISDMTQSSAISNEVGKFYVDCVFEHGENERVTLQTAPVKSLARMKEKLTEYVAPLLSLYMVFCFEHA